MSASLVNQRPRRLEFPPLTDEQQVLFSFADDFPKDQRKPEAERVLAARRRGKSTRVVVPAGMHVQVRDRADLPWQPIEPQRGRGRPPKPSSGTWEDDDLLAKVKAILGDPDEREHSGPEVSEALCRLARQTLGPQEFTADRRQVLKSLAMKVRPSIIVRQLLAWRHDLTDPAVRRMLSRKPAANDLTALVLKYEAEQPLLDEHGNPVKDKNGRPILIRPPVCDDDGQPILWVPDEHGQPSHPHVSGEQRPRRRVDRVRPRVRMIFRY